MRAGGRPYLDCQRGASVQITLADGTIRGSFGVNPGAVAPPVLQWVSRDPIGLRFAAQEGVAYQVRFRPDLFTGAWQLLQSVPAGPARQVDVTDAPVEAQRFYQVIVP